MTTHFTQLNQMITEDSSRSIRSNIWKLYALAAANEAFFLMPVIVPFFQENDLSLKEVFLLQGLFALTLMVLEIPSGYLSDRWGRKPTMLVGSAFGICGILMYALATTFWGFLAGEIFFAVMLSFYSGTKEAMMYDTLLELGKESDNRRAVGQQQFVGLTSQALASIIGGLIAVMALRTVAWVTLLPLIVGLGIAFSLQEPKRHKLQETRHFKAIWDVTTHALVKNIPLRSIILLYAVIASLTFALVWFTQTYQTIVGLPLSLFGVTHAVIMGLTGLASKWVHQLEKRVDDRVIMIAIAAAVVASYLALGFVTSLWGIMFLLLGRVMWGFLTPLTSDMINRMTTSDVRATVLSTRSFAGNLLFGLAAPLMGYGADVLTLNQALLVTGLVSGTILTVIFVMMAPVWKQVPK